MTLKKTCKHGNSPIYKCKKCKSEYGRDYRSRNSLKLINQRRNYYNQNRTQILKNNRIYRMKRKRKIERKLGTRCKICGSQILKLANKIR